MDREVQDLNKQIYKRLEAALSLNLLSQIFLAVCDDVILRNQIAQQLEATFARKQTGDGSTRTYPLLVSLKLNVNDPNPVSEMAHWLRQHPNLEREVAPGFQILGVEQLTRQPSRIQRQFLNYLQMIGQSWPLPLESTLLLWMPRPWLFSIQQSAPDFWRCRTGNFEFFGEPTAVSADFGVKEDADDRSWRSENQNATRITTVPPSQKIEVDPLESSSQADPRKEASAADEQGLKSLRETKNEAIALANAYRDRIHQGEATAENLISAIIAYEQGIEYLEYDSGLWADILNDLGNLYWMRSRQIANREQSIAYLEQGIKAYKIALSHSLQFPKDSEEHLQGKNYGRFPWKTENQKPGWQKKSGLPERLQNNLGGAYSELARYREPVKNLQESIVAYREALGSSQEGSDSKQHAATLNNLGTCYWNLAQHQQPVANLKQAIGAYEEALSYSSPSQDPLNYGMMQNNLGTAYWNLGAWLSEPEAYLQMAVNAYKIAIQYRTVTAAPAAHAATQNNLGTAYWHLANQEGISDTLRVEFLSKCISAYQQALETAEDGELTDLSFDIWATQNNLGLAYYQKASFAEDSQVENKLHDLDAALDCHLQALSGWKNQPELYEGAFNYVIQVIRVLYRAGGLPGQNQALSRVPPSLLPEILRRL